MYERFTDQARKVMALANHEAQRFNHEYLGTEHILLGLVKEGFGVGANILKNLHVDLSKVRLEVEKFVKSGPETVTMGKLSQTPRAKKVIEYAIEEARNLNHNYVGTEHLLLGLLREKSGVAVKVLMNLGLSLNQVREEVLKLVRVMDALEIEGPVIVEPKYGPEQVKTFNCTAGHDLEYAVNTWLSENPDIKIVERLFAGTHNIFYLVIHYRPCMTAVVLEPAESKSL